MLTTTTHLYTSPTIHPTTRSAALEAQSSVNPTPSLLCISSIFKILLPARQYFKKREYTISSMYS
jgi:hypothetical protein